MKNFAFRSIAVLALSISVVSNAYSLVGPIHFDTIAVAGQAAPGAPAGSVFDSFGTRTSIPAVDEQGGVAFWSILSGPSININNDFGLWTNARGAVELLTLEGDPAPGFGSGLFLTGPNPNTTGITSDGEFIVLLSAYSPAFEAILIGDPDGSSVLVYDGGAVPGYPGHAFTSVGRPKPLFNKAGAYSFLANDVEIGSGNDSRSALWSDTGGSLEIIVERDESLPGYPSERVFFWFDDQRMNSAGDHVVWAADHLYVTPTSVADEQEGIWKIDSSGQRIKIARSSEQAPGAPPGSPFIDFSRPTTDADGRVAFSARVSGVGESIFMTQSNDVLEAVALRNAQAPGMPAGVAFEGFGLPTLTNQGQAVFVAIVNGPGITDDNNGTVWLGNSDQLDLFIREGDTFPGVTPTKKVAGWGGFAINASGEMMFSVRLLDELDQSTTSILWFRETDGTLHEMLRTGDLYDVNDGQGTPDERTIASIIYRGGNNETGELYSLADSGDFTLKLRFDDGSEAIVSGVVPEPNSSVLLGLAGLTLLHRRRAG